MNGHSAIISWIILISFGAGYQKASALQSAPRSHTQFGLQLQGNHVANANAVGVKLVRMQVQNTPAFYDPRNIVKVEAAGIAVSMSVHNQCQVGEPTSCAITSDKDYEAQIAKLLDGTKPTAPIVIQNEEDDLGFNTATPAEYVRQLRDAADVAHSTGDYAGQTRHYKIANGGLTSSGVRMAYWHHLRLTGQFVEADAFASRNFTKTDGPNFAKLLPSAQNPTAQVAGRIGAKLARVEYLLGAYRTAGIDYLNFHWYDGDPNDMAGLIAWLKATTGLPVMSNEMGEHSSSLTLMQANLQQAVDSGLAYVLWNTTASSTVGSIQTLTASPSAMAPQPTASGVAFLQFVASHPN